jgi:hypothetical protein
VIVTKSRLERVYILETRGLRPSIPEVLVFGLSSPGPCWSGKVKPAAGRSGVTACGLDVHLPGTSPPGPSSTPLSLHPRYRSNPTTALIHPSSTLPPPSPTSASADPGEDPVPRITIVVDVELASASNEISTKGSGRETGES